MQGAFVSDLTTNDTDRLEDYDYIRTMPSNPIPITLTVEHVLAQPRFIKWYGASLPKSKSRGWDRGPPVNSPMKCVDDENLR